MPRSPLGLQDNDPAFALQASNVEAWLDDTYNQSIADASAGVNWINAQTEGFLPANSGPANLTALNAIIATLNSTGGALYIPVGTYNIEGVPDAITHGGVLIFGDGGATILRQTALSTTGRFFTIGQAIGAQTARVTIRDMQLQCLNTPSPGTLPDNSPAFYVQNAGNWTIVNIFVTGIASFLRVGVDATDTNNSHGGYVNNIVGTQADAGGRSIHLRRCASAFFENMELHVSGGTDVGIPVFIEPAGGPSPAAIEGVWFTNCVWFSTPPGGVQSDPGQVAGVRVDHTGGAVSNIWFTACNWDFASVGTVDIVATGGAYNCRYMKFTDCYLGGAAGGPGNRVRIQNNGTGKVMSPTFINCMMSYGDDPAVHVSGTGSIIDVAFHNCQLVDVELTVNKSAAFSMAKGNFTLTGNHVRGFDGAATNTNYVVETTADISAFTVTGNGADNMATGFFNHFAYATIAGANRIVANNFPDESVRVIASATALKVPPGTRVVEVTGTTAITSIDGPRGPLTLKFSGAVTVAGAALHLAGSTFTSTSEDTLSLTSNQGATWWEQGRSNNT